MDVVQNSESQTPLCKPNSKILKSKYYPTLTTTIVMTTCNSTFSQSLKTEKYLACCNFSILPLGESRVLFNTSILMTAFQELVLKLRV